MRRLARSTLAATLAGSLLLAPTFAAEGATGGGSGSVTRNKPYGPISQDATATVQSAEHARQVAAARKMPYFVISHAETYTTMDHTVLTRAAAPAATAVATAATVRNSNATGGSGISTGAWLLGAAAVVLLALALSLALAPRWRSERAVRAERDRRRVR